jgi:hypothetical protein
LPAQPPSEKENVMPTWRVEVGTEYRVTHTEGRTYVETVHPREIALSERRVAWGMLERIYHVRSIATNSKLHRSVRSGFKTDREVEIAPALEKGASATYE